MQIDLSATDASFLREHLQRRLQAIEDELVHTEQRSMQRELAEDAQRLRALIARFAS